MLLVTAQLRFAPKAGHANALLPRMRRKAKEWWNTPLVGTSMFVREWHRGNYHALLVPGQANAGVGYLRKLANVLGIFSHHFPGIFILHCVSPKKQLWITTSVQHEILPFMQNVQPQQHMEHWWCVKLTHKPLLHICSQIKRVSNPRTANPQSIKFLFCKKERSAFNKMGCELTENTKILFTPNWIGNDAQKFQFSKPMVFVAEWGIYLESTYISIQHLLISHTRQEITNETETLRHSLVSVYQPENSKYTW